MIGNIYTDMVNTKCVVLCKLLEIISGRTFKEVTGRQYAKNPRTVFEAVENAQLAINFCNTQGIRLKSLGAKDLVDGNKKSILALFTLIVRHYSTSSVNGLKGVIAWCNSRLKRDNYARFGVPKVKDFTTSWKTGLTIVAVLHSYFPQAVAHPKFVINEMPKTLWEYAFDIMQARFNCHRLIDISDYKESPDKECVITLLGEYYNLLAVEMLDDGWERHYDEENNPYYYHRIHGTSWNNPFVDSNKSEQEVTTVVVDNDDDDDNHNDEDVVGDDDNDEDGDEDDHDDEDDDDDDDDDDEEDPDDVDDDDENDDENDDDDDDDDEDDHDDDDDNESTSDEDLPLDSAWRKMSTENGETYYVNDDLGLSQWERPSN